MQHPAFDLLEELRLPGGMARHLRHRGRGADVVVLDDGRRESCFSISFATNPPDDAGAAHVLEHLIFRGSRRHPEDQLYTALRTGSLLSHLNAATRPSSTSYQLASPVEADLLRAEAILLEAVLHPLLRADAFAQEGISWSGGGPSGVVFHEMTGHMARPEAQLEAGLRRALFPGLPEGRSYGGDPAALARLRLGDVAAFHRRHYSPENALVILSGAADPKPRLDGLDAAFCAASAGVLRRPIGGGEGSFGAALRIGEAGPSALGWRLPGLSQDLLLLLAEVLRRAALPGLWPQSGAVLDGRLPWVQVFGSGALSVAPERIGGALSTAETEEAITRCLTQLLDETADFRLPAGLQSRARLLGHWLGGAPLLTALASEQRLAQALAQPLQARAAVIEVLAHLPAPQEAPVWSSTQPEPPINAPSPPSGKVLANGWRLAPLPRVDLPKTVEPPQWAERRGILLAPDAGDGLLRLTLGLRLRQAPTEGVDAAILEDLPLPRSAVLSLSRPPGDQEMLLIGLKLLEEDLPALLPCLKAALSRPFSLPQGKAAAHLALAGTLRQAIWQGSALGLGVGRSFAPVAVTLATNRARAVDVLAEFAASLPQDAGRICLASPATSIPCVPLRVEAPGLALPLAGRAADLSALNPALAWLALRAAEHGWLWPRLRVEGGAYGLRVELHGDGIATIVTAQDPRPSQSLAVMGQAGEWLSRNATPEMLEQARIAAVGAIVAPVPPDLRLERLVLAKMAGRQADWRKGDLDAVLDCDLSGLKRLGEALDAALACGPSAIMGQERTDAPLPR